jgi:hypothetical protein
LEAARKAYAEALLMKDFTNGDKAIVREELMDLQIGGGMAGKAAAHAQQRLSALENLTGGAIEDTHPYAQQEFNTWVSAFVTEKLRTNDIRKAFLKTAPLYDKYALVRDRAEYLFLYPNSPLFSDEINTQITALLSTCKYIGEKDAARRSAELKRSVADHNALKVAGIVTARRMKEEAGKLGEYTANVSNPDASICAAPALLYSELGLPNPYSKLVRENASAARDFKLARSSMNRAAARHLVMQMMQSEGVSSKVATERYNRLTQWFDETLLLASFYHAQKHSVQGTFLIELVLRNVDVFSLSEGQERAFVANLIREHMIKSGLTAEWRDSMANLEGPREEYERLTSTYGEAKLLNAARALRAGYIPYERGIYHGRIGENETGYSTLLAALENTVH